MIDIKAKYRTLITTQTWVGFAITFTATTTTTPLG